MTMTMTDLLDGDLDPRDPDQASVYWAESLWGYGVFGGDTDWFRGESPSACQTNAWDLVERCLDEGRPLTEAEVVGLVETIVAAAGYEFPAPSIEFVEGYDWAGTYVPMQNVIWFAIERTTPAVVIHELAHWADPDPEDAAHGRSFRESHLRLVRLALGDRAAEELAMTYDAQGVGERGIVLAVEAEWLEGLSQIDDLSPAQETNWVLFDRWRWDGEGLTEAEAEALVEQLGGTPVTADSPVELLYEVARQGVSGHGRKFREAHVRVVRLALGDMAAHELADLYVAHGLDNEPIFAVDLDPDATAVEAAEAAWRLALRVDSPDTSVSPEVAANWSLLDRTLTESEARGLVERVVSDLGFGDDQMPHVQVGGGAVEDHENEVIEVDLASALLVLRDVAHWWEGDEHHGMYRSAHVETVRVALGDVAADGLAAQYAAAGLEVAR